MMRLLSNPYHRIKPATFKTNLEDINVQNCDIPNSYLHSICNLASCEGYVIYLVIKQINLHICIFIKRFIENTHIHYFQFTPTSSINKFIPCFMA